MQKQCCFNTPIPTKTPLKTNIESGWDEPFFVWTNPVELYVFHWNHMSTQLYIVIVPIVPMIVIPTMWAPLVISWFISPNNQFVISTKNYSYWSYLHQLSYLGGRPHIVSQLIANILTIFSDSQLLLASLVYYRFPTLINTLIVTILTYPIFTGCRVQATHPWKKKRAASGAPWFQHGRLSLWPVPW